MHYSDKTFTHNELLSALTYDPFLIQMNQLIEYPHSILVCASYKEIMHELKMFNKFEYSITNVQTNTFTLSYRIRFKSKNNLLKFKLKSSII